ncbi:hypothetical protein VTH06DRAFT_1974 [Thermothelomyces fergusii]
MASSPPQQPTSRAAGPAIQTLFSNKPPDLGTRQRIKEKAQRRQNLTESQNLAFIIRAARPYFFRQSCRRLT